MATPLRTRSPSAAIRSEPTKKPAPREASMMPNAAVPPCSTLTANRNVRGYTAPMPTIEATTRIVLASKPAW